MGIQAQGMMMFLWVKGNRNECVYRQIFDLSCGISWNFDVSSLNICTTTIEVCEAVDIDVGPTAEWSLPYFVVYIEAEQFVCFLSHN